MSEKNLNQNAMLDIYKNAHTALQSISDIMPAATEEKLKTELMEQYEGYEKLIGELSTFMAEKKIEPKDIHPFKKAMLWSSIKMKTMVNNSNNKLADMMIQGTVMGITDLTTLKNEHGEELDKEVLEFTNRLLSLEENYEERLKNYL